jgi:hypothetical protein
MMNSTFPSFWIFLFSCTDYPLVVDRILAWSSAHLDWCHPPSEDSEDAFMFVLVEALEERPNVQEDEQEKEKCSIWQRNLHRHWITLPVHACSCAWDAHREDNKVSFFFFKTSLEQLSLPFLLLPLLMPRAATAVGCTNSVRKSSHNVLYYILPQLKCFCCVFFPQWVFLWHFYYPVIF